jgi:hypothetical protein
MRRAHLTVNGETLLMGGWVNRSGIGESTIRERLRRGWTPEEAVAVKPLRKGVEFLTFDRAKKAKRHGHGHARKRVRSSEYRTWTHMLGRCMNQRDQSWADYGGRGVYVAMRWRKFENFFSDVGPKPSPSHSLDRVDNDGPYAWWNCRWATPLEQANNKRNNRLITHARETLSLTQWARRVGLKPGLLYGRISRGWLVETAISLAPPLPHGQKSHCPRGHLYDDTNTMVRKRSNGRTSRDCKTCHRERVVAKYRSDPAHREAVKAKQRARYVAGK